MMLDAPCIGCSERAMACHTKCLRYKDFKRRHDAEVERIRRQSTPDAVFGEIKDRADRINKIRKKERQ